MCHYNVEYRCRWCSPKTSHPRRRKLHDADALPWRVAAAVHTQNCNIRHSSREARLTFFAAIVAVSPPPRVPVSPRPSGPCLTINAAAQRAAPLQPSGPGDRVVERRQHFSHRGADGGGGGGSKGQEGCHCERCSAHSRQWRAWVPGYCLVWRTPGDRCVRGQKKKFVHLKSPSNFSPL